jgi:hypothetical protein
LPMVGSAKTAGMATLATVVHPFQSSAQAFRGLSLSALATSSSVVGGLTRPTTVSPGATAQAVLA